MKEFPLRRLFDRGGDHLPGRHPGQGVERDRTHQDVHVGLIKVNGYEEILSLGLLDPENGAKKRAHRIGQDGRDPADHEGLEP